MLRRQEPLNRQRKAVGEHTVRYTKVKHVADTSAMLVCGDINLKVNDPKDINVATLVALMSRWLMFNSRSDVHTMLMKKAIPK